MVDMAFDSRMTEVHRGSDFNEVVNGMFDHMRAQMENPAFRRSGFRFGEVLHMDVNFHQLNLTRDSSYIHLPKWIANKRGVINPKNENDEECFKWALIPGLHYSELK